MKIRDRKKWNFYQYPKWLYEPPYNKLSDKAKLIFPLFWDRTSLSEAKGWYDSSGNLYIYYSIEKLMKKLNCTDKPITKAKRELADAGLIKEVRQGVNKPNKIYVFEPNVGIGESTTLESEKVWSGIGESTTLESEKVRGIKTEYIKTNISRLSEPEGVGETSYIDIGTPPPPPKKSMDFGRFVKTSGLKVGQEQIQHLLEYVGVDNMPLDLVKLAITKTVDQGIEAPAYTFSILDNWKAKGITTVEQALKEQEEFEARKSSKQKNSYIDEDEARRMQEKYGF